MCSRYGGSPAALSRQRWCGVTYRKPSSCPISHASLAEVLEGLLRHPQIQRLQLDSDLTDGWRVGAQLAQLLPIDEGL